MRDQYCARRPLHSREIIIRLYLGLFRKALKVGEVKSGQFVVLNQDPAAVVFFHGVLDTVFSVTVSDGRTEAIYQQRNPEKLCRLRVYMPSQGEQG